MFTYFLLNYLIIFLVFVFYFFIREYKRVFKNNYKKRELIFLIFILIGLEIFLYEYFFVYLDKDFLYLSITPIIIAVFSIYVEKIFSIMFGVMVFFIFSLKFIFLENKNSLYLVPLISYLFEFILIYFIIEIKNNKYLSKNGFKLFITILSWDLSYLLFMIIFYELNYINISFVFFSLFYSSVLFFNTFLFYVLEKIYNNFLSLKGTFYKDEISFFKISLYEQELKKYILNNNFNFGSVVVIEMHEEINNEEKKPILNKISKTLNLLYDNKVVFFRISTNIYGFFFSLKIDDREELTSINEINDLLKKDKGIFFKNSESVIKKYWYDNKIKSASGAIYGVESNDIISLIKNCRYLLSEKNLLKENEKEPIIKIFEGNKLIDFNTSEILENQELIDYVLNIKINYIRSSYSDKIYYYDYKFPKDAKLKLFSLEDKINIERFVAYNSVKNFNFGDDKKLIIKFPFETLSNSKFNLNLFISKINKFVDNQRIIIDIIFVDSNFKSNNFIFNENISNIYKNNFSFICDNNNQSLFKKFEIFYPKYEFLNKEFSIGNEDSLFNKKINIKEVKEIA